QDGRNTNYGPTISNWDLRVTKSIPLYKERVRFNLALDAFNVFNQANFLAANVRNGRFNFVAATGAFTPGGQFRHIRQSDARQPDFADFRQDCLLNGCR